MFDVQLAAANNPLVPNPHQLIHDPPFEDMQQALIEVSNVDARLNHRRQNHHIPQFQINGLTNFQRMLKCLMECYSKPTKRGTTYADLVHRIQMQTGLPVTPFSVLIFTAEHFEEMGTVKRKGSVIVEFVDMYHDHLAEMGDAQFIERLTDIDGIGYYTAFQMNLFGRRRFNFFPAGFYPFRRALGWFREEYDDVNPPATPTPEQAIENSWIWHPRRGIAAYIIWATAPIRT